MDILITCIAYIFLTGSLIYIFLAEKGKRARKKQNVLEVHFANWTGLVFWVICFLANTLFTLGYYIKFFSNNFRLTDYLITAILFSCPLLLSYFLERWKVIIDGEKVIKYGLLTKRAYNISDITEIKQAGFGHKYYVEGKKVFSTNARYHHYSGAFENYIKEKATD